MAGNMHSGNLDQTGQHYMIDKKLIKLIISESMLEKDDVVLDIGAGNGELTWEIAKTCKVIAVDIENNLAKNKSSIKNKNVTFMHGNILNIIDDVKFTKIVSNIPYNISEPLMRKIFKKDIDLCILTVGKTFAEILESKDNRIGILANHFYEVELLRTVSPKAFNPAPKTDSAIVRLEPKEIDDLSRADVMMRELLFSDEKKLKNAFESIFKEKTKKQVDTLLKNFKGMDFLDKKIYELKNEEFILLETFVEQFSNL